MGPGHEPRDILPRLTERFYRAPPARKSSETPSGTGLGLQHDRQAHHQSPSRPAACSWKAPRTGALPLWPVSPHVAALAVSSTGLQLTGNLSLKLSLTRSIGRAWVRQEKWRSSNSDESQETAVMSDRTGHTVRSYEEELNQLAAEVARMGGLTEAQVSAAPWCCRPPRRGAAGSGRGPRRAHRRAGAGDREPPHPPGGACANPWPTTWRQTLSAIKIAGNLERWWRPGQAPSPSGAWC